MKQVYIPDDTPERIRRLIKSSRITQAELAEKVGLSASASADILRGRQRT